MYTHIYMKLIKRNTAVNVDNAKGMLHCKGLPQNHTNQMGPRFCRYKERDNDAHLVCIGTST